MALAFKHTAGTNPGVLFLPGFHSTMQGDKAKVMEQYCQTRGVQFTRFDYSGHGDSPGLFEDGTIEQWRNDVIDILDNVCTGPQVLVGSSMGGWLATLAALARPERTFAIVGIASAPDLTDELLSPALSAEQHKALDDGEVVEIANDYENIDPHRFRKALLTSGTACNVLGKTLPLECPVRLLHGTADNDVPWSLSERLLACFASDDAQLLLLKGADHRFSKPRELDVILKTLEPLLTP